MRILLTGASGLVGAAFARAAARRGHAVTGIVGGFTGELPGVATRRALDLCDEATVTASVPAEFPEAIVNAAAVSVPEACDADPARAKTLDVALPSNLARLVRLSSEQAFDGTRTTPYAAGDLPSPVNLYGRQKIAGERAVQALAPEFSVSVRAPLPMGNSPGGRRSTRGRLFADRAAGRAAKLYTDEYRRTCTAENLAAAMLEPCERRDVRGVVHRAGAELLSRHEPGLRARVGLLKTRPQTIAEQLAELRVPPASVARAAGA